MLPSREIPGVEYHVELFLVPPILREVDLVDSRNKRIHHWSAEDAALQVRVFLPLEGPANPSQVGVHFFGIFCSFEFSRDRQCHGTRKCPHRLSSDKLLHVVVPEPIEGQITRVKASEALQECVGIVATLQHTHAQHAGPHTHTYQHQQQAHQQSNTPQSQARASRSMEEGGERRCAWRLCPG